MMYATLDDWREVAETNEIARYMPVAHHQARLVEQRRARNFALCGTRHVGAAPIRDALHRFKERGLLPVEVRPLSPKDIRDAVRDAGGVRPVYLKDADLALAKTPLLAEIGKAIDEQPLYLSTSMTLTELRASWTKRQFEAAAPLLTDLLPHNLRATTETVWANTVYMALFLDLARVVYSHGQGEAVSLVQRQAVLNDFTRYAPEFQSPSPEVFERLVHRRKYGSERVYQSELKTLRVRSHDERWLHEAPDLRIVRGLPAQPKRAVAILALPAPPPKRTPTPEPETPPEPEPPSRRTLIHAGASAAAPVRGAPVRNEDGVGLKGCSYIYAPAGQAGEYAPLATNPYRGCGHGCAYCYVPRAIKIQRPEFDAGARERPSFREGLLRDAKKYQAAAITEQVMLSFTTDPYPPPTDDEPDHHLTRWTLETLAEHGLAFCTLTKGGSRALRDIDLFRPDRDGFASTLTSLDPAFSRKWERYAAEPEDRIATLRAFRDRGIFTWVSLEPTLDVEASLAIVEATHGFVDLFKVGRANYLKEITRTTDWRDYTLRMLDMLNRVGAKHYIKHDLQPYLPEGYDNPLRVPQHH